MALLGRRKERSEGGRRVLDRAVAWRSRIPLILLLPLGLVLSQAARRVPRVAEIYAHDIFPWISRALGALTGWLPIAIAEILALLLLLWLLLSLWKTIRSLRLGNRRLRNVLLLAAVNGLALAGLLYGGGVLLWGLNYHRSPFAESAGWDTSPATVEELRSLCLALVDETNAARGRVEEDDDGVMRLADTNGKIFAEVWRGFHRARQLYPPLEQGHAGRAKGLSLLSTPLSYFGISGIFVMYTGEPTVNTKQPDVALPSTACHEISHQLGFAREEEANFVGYLACTHHPDPQFRYSGYFRAMRYAMAALQRVDRESYRELADRLSVAVWRDWHAVRAFWESYESPVSEAAYRVNDLYLKSQGQEAGVSSYGLMVDLLIAERRAEGGPISRPRP